MHTPGGRLGLQTHSPQAGGCLQDIAWLWGVRLVWPKTTKKPAPRALRDALPAARLRACLAPGCGATFCTACKSVLFALLKRKSGLGGGWFLRAARAPPSSHTFPRGAKTAKKPRVTREKVVRIWRAGGGRARETLTTFLRAARACRSASPVDAREVRVLTSPTPTHRPTDLRRPASPRSGATGRPVDRPPPRAFLKRARGARSRPAKRLLKTFLKVFKKFLKSF